MEMDYAKRCHYKKNVFFQLIEIRFIIVLLTAVAANVYQSYTLPTFSAV